MAGASAVVARILTQYTDKGSKAAQKDIARLEKKINAFGKKAVKSFGLAAAASAALAVKIGFDSVKAASDDLKSQEALAGVLRTVTGASAETIAAIEEHISKQQMLTNITDNELRASLSRLVTVTGNVTAAMDLNSVAVDAAAGSGNDFEATTAAIAKATGGNFKALKALFPALDASIVKNKDLGKALTYLDLTYKGAAERLAKKDPITGLKIAFGEVAEKLGGALLPAVILFAEYVKSEVIPLINAWTTANQDGLNAALQDSVGKIKEVVDAFKDIYTVLSGINAILPLGIGGWLKLTAAISTASTAVGVAVLLIARYKALKVFASVSRDKTAFLELRKEMSFFRRASHDAIAAFRGIGAWAAKSKGFLALLTRGFIALNKAIFMTPWGRLLLVAVGLGYAFKKLAENFNWFGMGKDKAAEATAAALEKEKKDRLALNKVLMSPAARAAKVKAAKEEEARVARLAAMNAKTAAANAKQEKIDAKNAALKKQIQDKYKIKITDSDEYENIQLEAVKKLQEKQKNADASVMNRIKMRKEEIALFEQLNKNAERYADILTVLADEKLSDLDIVVLGKKWGITTDAVKSYIATLFMTSDGVISDYEVKTLMAAWNMTEAQARQYLEFLKVVEKGTISDENIKALARKWYGSDSDSAVSQARQYADFVEKIHDGKLTNKEIEDLKLKWNLTTAQVVAYITQTKMKVDATGTILSAGDIAALGWTNALTALNAFLAKLNSSSFVFPKIPDGAPPAATGCPTGSTMINGKCTPIGTNPKVTDPAATGCPSGSTMIGGKCVPIVPKGDDKIVVTPDYSGDDGIARRAAAAGLAAKNAAEAERLAALAKQNAQFAAKAAAMQAAADAAALAASSEVNAQASALAAFKDKEARDLAAAQATAASNAALDVDERSQFRAMQDAFKSSAYQTPTGKFESPFMDNSKGLTGKLERMDTNVYVTVNGSVTTENDLVQTVRNGLLRGQSNGQTLTLEAV